MNITPSLDAARHYTPLLDAAQEDARREAQMREDFLALAGKADLSAPAPFARDVLDHDRRTAAGIPTRGATLFDVLSDAIDYSDFDRRMFTVLLRAARGEWVQVDAQDLLSRMAVKFASMNSEDA